MSKYDKSPQVMTAEGHLISIAGMQETLRAYPMEYLAQLSDDGVPFIKGMVHREPGCGCKIVGNGTLQFPVMIEFCKQHKKMKGGKK